ncbi:MAG: excalibur calcium-binding domain-containing protein [Nocardioidaceae bacterium]
MKTLVTTTVLGVALAATAGIGGPAHGQAPFRSTTDPKAATSVRAGQTPPYAANAKKAQRIRFRAAVRSLPVARQTPRGYDRAKFGDWRDSDGDCRDTRAEVLVQESRRPVTRRCTVVRGRGVSSYDKRFWRLASDVDIDHLVPLFEVWRSGGRSWAPARRVAYSNDLADGRTLKAVTDNVNQSKGDSDPARWLPQYGRCVYVAQYAAVKIRWSLKVDAAEKRAMRQVAAHCRNVMITVHQARVVTRRSGGAGTDPRFDTCAEAIAHGYGPYYRGRDPEYAWYVDADGDGVVCES